MFGMSGYEYNVKRIGYNHELLGQWCSYEAAIKWRNKFARMPDTKYCFFLVRRKVVRHRSADE